MNCKFNLRRIDICVFFMNIYLYAYLLPNAICIYLLFPFFYFSIAFCNNCTHETTFSFYLQSNKFLIPNLISFRKHLSFIGISTHFFVNTFLVSQRSKIVNSSFLQQRRNKNGDESLFKY